MAIPAIPAQGAPWYSYAQGLDDEIRNGRLSDAALRAAFVSGGLPAHAGSRIGRFDTQLSIYNLKASNVRRARAAMAAARAGTGTCRITLIGDSLTVGYNNVRGSSDPAAYFKSILAATGLTVSEIVHGYSNGYGTGSEPRFTATGGAWPGGVMVTFPWPSFHNAGTFTTTGTGTVLEIITSEASAGFSYTIDGGAPATVTTSGASALKVITVTGLSNASHTLVITAAAAGDSYVYAAGFRQATGVIVENAGITSATAGNWIAEPFGAGAGFGPAWSLFSTGSPVRDVVIIELGVNEAFTAVPPATYRANLTSLVGQAQAAGADVMLATSNRPATTSVATATYDAILSAAYDVADTKDIPLLDMADRFGLYTQYNADGLGWDQASDTLHLTASGNAHKARGWASLVTA